MNYDLQADRRYTRTYYTLRGLVGELSILSCISASYIMYMYVCLREFETCVSVCTATRMNKSPSRKSASHTCPNMDQNALFPLDAPVLLLLAPK